MANYVVLFVVSVFLTRLLSPTEYGAFGIVSAVIGIAAIFVDFGFYASVVQAKEITQTQLSTIFLLNIAFAIGLVIVIGGSSFYLESFYGVESLSLYIIYATSLFILSALKLIPSALLQRQMRFRSKAVIETIAAVTSGSIAIGMTLYGFKIWALITQQVLGTLVGLIGMTYITRWLPSLSVSLRSIRTLWEFGSRLFVAGLINTVFTRIDVFIIGKLFPIEMLGLYNRSQSLDSFGKGFTRQTTSAVTFPFFSRIQDDVVSIKRYYLKALHAVSFLTTFVAAFLSLTSHDIIVLLFGMKWIGSAPYFRILSFTAFVIPISVLMLSILKAKGRSGAFLKLEIVKKIQFIPAYLVLYFFGIGAFLIALGVISVLNLAYNAIYVGRETETSVTEQLAIISRYIAISFGVSVPLMFALGSIESYVTHLLVSGALFSVLFLGVSLLLRLQGFFELWSRAKGLYADGGS